MTGQLALLAYVVSSCAFFTYTGLSSIFSKSPQHRTSTLRRWWLITKWIGVTQPAFTTLVLTVNDAFNPFMAFVIVFNCWLWWACRNSGDDDFFTKLKKNVTETVKAVAGRLVVVPVGGHP